MTTYSPRRNARRFLLALLAGAALIGCSGSWGSSGSEPLPRDPEQTAASGERATQGTPPLEVTCGRRDACDAEARRRCPSGYRVLSEHQDTRPGVESVLLPQTHPGGIEGANSTAPGTVHPNSPVVSTRLEISCY